MTTIDISAKANIFVIRLFIIPVIYWLTVAKVIKKTDNAKQYNVFCPKAQQETLFRHIWSG
jgi:hypothetical protein